ncbi:hypothetical protein [Anaeromyxobacter sp. SG66]|uniref:hypothetical protein n=1 Tax=Anaeromyxobacter sp. SG66 TaxID=2925410 RepID=UPI001F58E8AB|nr:hypothetical protein [Anaeromyxobacter sp. SG66]
MRALAAALLLFAAGPAAAQAQTLFVRSGTPTALSTSAGTSATSTSALLNFGETIDAQLFTGDTGAWQAGVVNGTITCSLWGYESSTNANVGLRAVISDTSGSVICSTPTSVEAGTATGGVALSASCEATNFAMSGTTGIRIAVYVTSKSTAGGTSGVYTVRHYFNGPTSGASGYSYCTVPYTVAPPPPPAATAVVFTN